MKTDFPFEFKLILISELADLFLFYSLTILLISQKIIFVILFHIVSWFKTP